MNGLRPRIVPPATALVDAAVVTLLSLLAVIGFTPAFGGWGYLGAAIGGLLVGSVAAIVGALYRLSVLMTALVAVGAYLVFGSAFAMSSVATLGFLPNAETLSGLVVGAVFGWTDIVTLLTPIGAPAYITVVPYLASWLVGVVGVTLALRWIPLRPRFTGARGVVLLISPVVLFLAGILVGTHDPFQAAVRGVGFAAISLIWLGWRSRPSAENGGTRGRLILRRKLVGTAALVVTAVAGGSIAGFAFVPSSDSRFVVRDHVAPPFDPIVFSSPLSGFRSYSKLRTDETIFTISGLQPGQLVRLATLDSYDGVIWSVAGAEQAESGSGSYALVGQNMPAPDFAVANTSTLDITVGKYSDVWLPTVDYAAQVLFEGEDAQALAAGLRFNASSGTGVVTSGLHEGDTYRLTVVSPADLGDLGGLGTAPVALPPATTVQVVGAKAVELAGEAVAPYDKLGAIASYLADNGYLRHGFGLDIEPAPASRAGHSAERLIKLFAGAYMVGDAEQFASAFALMARSLGYPSRVVMGFAPPDGASGTVAITGEDVTAWVEVPFEGVGWVPFFPTPTEVTEVPPDQVPEPQTKPQPQVRQPPRAIQNAEPLISPIEIDDEEKKDDSPFAIPGWVWVVAGWVGIPASLYFVPLLFIGLVKRRRRDRRRTAGEPVDRIAGGWDEFLDSYAEFGYPLTPKRTRTQLADDIATRADVEQGAVLTLAHGADRAMFSGREGTPDDVDKYWADAIAEIERMSGSAGRWRRFASRLYVRPRGLRAAGAATKRGRS